MYYDLIIIIKRLIRNTMKKIILLLSCIFVMTSMSAQTSFQGLTLEKALEQAKVENKYVFIDCYTSWCGPCKMMAEKILPLKEVGEYMNGKFVCYASLCLSNF